MVGIARAFHAVNLKYSPICYALPSNEAPLPLQGRGRGWGQPTDNKNEGGDKPTLVQNRYCIVLISYRTRDRGVVAPHRLSRLAVIPLSRPGSEPPVYGADLPESGTREDKALAYDISLVRRHSSTLPSVASLATRKHLTSRLTESITHRSRIASRQKYQWAERERPRYRPGCGGQPSIGASGAAAPEAPSDANGT